MSQSNYLSGQTFNQATASQFIAEVWLPELMTFKKQRLIELGNICKVFGGEVKKGDLFHIPRVGELTVEDKQTDQPLAMQVDDNTDYTVSVDTDRVASIGIDNFFEVMANYAVRQPYVAEMGYAMQKDLSLSLLGLRAALYNIPEQNIFASSTGTLAGNGNKLDLAAILAARQTLLDADVDLSDICCLVSPQQETSLLSLIQATSGDYVSGRPTETGDLGTLYGIKFWRSTLMRANGPQGTIRRLADGVMERSPSPGFAGSRYLPKQNNVVNTLPATFGGNSAPVHSALMCSKEWAAVILQNKLAPEVNYIPERMQTLIATRQTYGMKLYRQDHAVLIHTNG
jgi:hypothetical protein